jgi:uncharacterized protein (DUF58 family)
VKNNDKCGLVLFTDRVEKFVPPRKGTSHVLRVIRELLAFRPAGRGTNIGAAMEHLNRVTRRRAVVFLISDFIDSGFEHALQIARRRHDLILVQADDRRERELPALGLIDVIDNETGRRLVVDTSSRRWRARHARLAAERLERFEAWRRRARIDGIRVSTGESFVEPLVAFFRAREARV